MALAEERTNNVSHFDKSDQNLFKFIANFKFPFYVALLRLLQRVNIPFS